MSLGNCGLRKTWLDKCLKSDVSQRPSTINMLKGAKHCLNLLAIFFITIREIKFENGSPSDI